MALLNSLFSVRESVREHREVQYCAKELLADSRVCAPNNARKDGGLCRCRVKVDKSDDMKCFKSTRATMITCTKNNFNCEPIELQDNQSERTTPTLS